MTGDAPDEIVIADGIEEDLAELLADTGMDHDEFRALLTEHAELGKPILEPPIPADDIEDIPDERRRMLAWDLLAIASAYNHASDPTLPDLARDDVDTWVGPEVEARLETACALLMDAYDLLIDDIDRDPD